MQTKLRVKIKFEIKLSFFYVYYIYVYLYFFQKFTADDRNNLLNDLAIILLYDNYTTEVATLFSPVLLDLLSRASDVTKDDKDDPITKHERLCICLSKLIWNFPEVARFVFLKFVSLIKKV